MKDLKKNFDLNALKLYFLLAYFVILTVERLISLARVFMGDFSQYDALDVYMTVLVTVSIPTTYVFLFIKLRRLIRHGKKRSASKKNESAKRSGLSLSKLTAPRTFASLATAAGILLSGGMVHTYGSIPPMQFVAYGMILVSMALHTVINVKKHSNADRKWLSFAYTVAFSMSIPVVYHTQIELAYLFIPIEIVVSLGLVILFTVMLRQFYMGSGECVFSLLPFLTALFGDALVLSMRWHEKVNVMVLIFICITSVLWFAGSVLGARRLPG